MFERGNVVCLNERGTKHYDKKYYRKRIYKDRLLIVISHYYKNNMKRYVLRDIYSDLSDKYYEMHLKLCYNTVAEAAKAIYPCDNFTIGTFS